MRKINDSYGGKKSTSTLFSRVVGIARIKISVSIRRFTDKFRHISKRLLDERHQNEEECESMLYEKKQSWNLTGY
jgi:cell division protein ZapA (FtsZ GTPase activity inhibitor)